MYQRKKSTGLSCSVLIPSCDKYSDLWKPFFTMFWRNWPDCPFPVHLGSNEQVFEHPRVTNIRIGPDKDWTSSTRKMLESLDTEYVLILLDDFFIRETVDTNRVLYFLDTLVEMKGHMLQLRKPIRRPFLRIKEFPDIVKLMTGTPYRVNLQPTIWRINSLLSIMRDGESPQEFEVNASKRSNKDEDGYYCLRRERPIEWKHHVVEKGKWFRSPADFFGKEDIGCDFSCRSVISKVEQFKWDIRKKINRFEEKIIPWTLKRKIGKLMKLKNNGKML